MRNLTRFLFVLTFCALVAPICRADTVFVPRGAEWKYDDTIFEPDPLWTRPSYNDSAWRTGSAQLGFNEGDEATLIVRGNTSYYFRHRFNVDLAALDPEEELQLELLRDDGAVVYLNGREIVRSNMDSGPVRFDTLAELAVGGGDEDRYFPFVISRFDLQDGENVFAVSVHQASRVSSDLSFDLSLAARRSERSPIAIETTKLIASNVNTGTTALGTTIDVENGLYFLGSGDVSFNGRGGSLFIYEPSTERPGEFVEKKIIAPATNRGRFANFARTSIDADGDLLAVGAFGDQVDLPNNFSYSGAGSVYIFEKNHGGEDNWGQSGRIWAEDIRSDKGFGFDLEVDGDTMVVGAVNSFDGGAYVFQRDPDGDGDWRQIKKIRPNPTAGLVVGGLGQSVAISGDLIAVGVPQIDSSNQPRGWVAIYQRDAGGVDNWGRVATVVAPNGPTDNRFGAELELEGNRLVASALRFSGINNSAGAVFIFERNEGGPENWGAVARLRSEVDGEQYGTALDLRGDTLMVGGWDSKTAYVYERNIGGEDNWGLATELNPSDDGVGPQTGRRFGQAVAIADGQYLVGASDDTAGLNRHGGSVYLFNHTRGRPIFGKPMQDTVRITGQSAEFDADPAGPGPIIYQWLRNGVQLPGQTDPTLSLRNLSPDDSGFYWLRADSEFGRNVTPPVHLTVVDEIGGTPMASIGTNTRHATRGDQFTVGYAFTLNSPQYLTHLGMHDVDDDGVDYPMEVGLWDRSTQRLLARVELGRPGTAEVLEDFYRYIPVEPMLLETGKQYIIAQFSQHQQPVSTVTATLEFAPEVNFIEDMRTRGSVMAFPGDQIDGPNNRIQPNMRFASEVSGALAVHLGNQSSDPEVPQGQGSVVEFPLTTIGSSGNFLEFLLRNKGDADLQISDLLLPPGFFLIGDLPDTIPPSESQVIQIELRSPLPGDFGGQVRLANSDQLNNPFEFTVAGEVVLPEVFLLTRTLESFEDEVDGLAATLRRNGPVDRELRVAITLAGEALIDEDFILEGYDPQTEEIVFPVGAGSVQLPLSLIADNLDEPDEVLIIRLGDGELYRRSPEFNEVGLTILDDDAAPVAMPDGPFELLEDGALGLSPAAGVLANDQDEDDGVAGLTAVLVSNVDHGQLVLGEDGSVNYQPEADYFGEDSFTYRASDGTNQSEPVTVEIRVLEQVDLRLAATESVDPVLAGIDDALTHSLILTNDGPSDATGLVLPLGQVLPAGVSLIGEPSPTLGELADGDWTIPRLAEGQSACLEIDFLVLATALGGTDSIGSSAEISQVDQPLVGPENDAAEIFTSVLSPASVRVVGQGEGGPRLNRQTGLFEQTLRITNDNPGEISGFRIIISDGLGERIVSTSTGMTAGGDPYFDQAGNLASGGSLDLNIEFFSPVRDGDFQPEFEVELLPRDYTAKPLGEGERFAIDRMLRLRDGSVLIEWPALVGAFYQVEYSGDMKTWKSAVGTIRSGGNRIQWIDHGAAKTDSHPSEAGIRYYRVKRLQRQVKGGGSDSGSDSGKDSSTPG